MSQNPSPDTATKRVGRWAGLFRPNTHVTTKTYYALIVGYIFIGLLGWTFLPPMFPSPLAVLVEFQQLFFEGGLLTELWASLVLSVQAIALSTVISLFLSYGSAIPVIRPIAETVGKMRFLSMIGFTFYLTLFIGGGHGFKLAMLTIGLTGFFVKSMTDVIQQVDESRLEYVRTLRANEWRVFLEERIYATAGQAFDIMRQNAAISWLMLTMVEGLSRSEGGIGTMLIDQEKHRHVAAIFAIQFVFLLAGVGQDAFIGWLKSMVAGFSMLSYKKGK
jgi:NitT/TauT family transport system permease protein